MAISFTTNKPITTKKKHTRVTAQKPLIDLNQPGRLRLANLMALYNVGSANTIYVWMNFGKIPAPTGRDPRPWWSTEIIREHLTGKVE